MAVNITLSGTPRTKKNSARIIMAGSHPRVIPSAAYAEYATMCMTQLLRVEARDIHRPVNLKCVYYMPTRRRVDLVNLIEATCDILVAAGILADDNAQIVAGHDGSRVKYDKDNPRVEIEIEEMRQ